MKKLSIFGFQPSTVLTILCILLAISVIPAWGAWREQVDITEVYTNQIQPIDPATSLTIGESGDTVTINAQVISNHKRIEIGDATTAAFLWANGDTIVVDKTVGLASLTVTLPTITEAMDGRIMYVYQVDSGTTACTLTPTATIDAIESTRGTLTGTSDATTDAIGDAKAFMVDYDSGVSPVWKQLWVNQS